MQVRSLSMAYNSRGLCRYVISERSVAQDGAGEVRRQGLMSDIVWRCNGQNEEMCGDEEIINTLYPNDN